MSPEYAQNLIYGAIEWAEDAGFEPPKAFNVLEYLLDDVEDIPYVDIKFGRDGKYFFAPGKDDDQKKIIETLNKNIGEGNYNYIAMLPSLESFTDIE